jgi:hypothetical protein
MLFTKSMYRLEHLFMRVRANTFLFSYTFLYCARTTWVTTTDDMGDDVDARASKRIDYWWITLATPQRRWRRG